MSNLGPSPVKVQTYGENESRLLGKARGSFHLRIGQQYNARLERSCMSQKSHMRQSKAFQKAVLRPCDDAT